MLYCFFFVHCHSSSFKVLKTIEIFILHWFFFLSHIQDIKASHALLPWLFLAEKEAYTFFLIYVPISLFPLLGDGNLDWIDRFCVFHAWRFYLASIVVLCKWSLCSSHLDNISCNFCYLFLGFSSCQAEES